MPIISDAKGDAIWDEKANDILKKVTAVTAPWGIGDFPYKNDADVSNAIRAEVVLDPFPRSVPGNGHVAPDIRG